MAHILLLEVPGGNDFTVLEDAAAMGHKVTFFTADAGFYQRQGGAVTNAMALSRDVVEVRPYSYAALEHRAREVHRQRPFDAIVCILDIRMIDASLLAQALGLRFLNPATTRMARDKFSVREALARHGVRQPAFALAESSNDLRRAAAAIGYPVLVKPSDGYGSQNVTAVFSDTDLEALISSRDAGAGQSADYGLGVRANNRLSVEQYVRGRMIGCDVFTSEQGRILLGINDKLMFPPPSFAIRGSCFPSDRFDTAAIRDYAFQILDAIGFDFGAAHIEMIVAGDGPYLVEVNTRLVSAQIPFQMGYALQRSIYADLINLHLGQGLTDRQEIKAHWFSAIRWIVADRPGRLETIELPVDASPFVRRVALFKATGDVVCPPLSNGDRIGYVIAVGESQAEAERTADHYVQGCLVRLQ